MGVVLIKDCSILADFDVRIVNDEGGVLFKGRVEVKIGGLWGTVSDLGWDIYDANVLCKQVDFGGAVGAYSGSSFGKGKGPIWMSNFQCKGSESSLAKCIHNSTEIQEKYGHYRDASVECYGECKSILHYTHVAVMLRLHLKSKTHSLINVNYNSKHCLYSEFWSTQRLRVPTQASFDIAISPSLFLIMFFSAPIL